MRRHISNFSLLRKGRKGRSLALSYTFFYFIPFPHLSLSLSLSVPLRHEIKMEPPRPNFLTAQKRHSYGVVDMVTLPEVVNVPCDRMSLECTRSRLAGSISLSRVLPFELAAQFARDFRILGDSSAFFRIRSLTSQHIYIHTLTYLLVNTYVIVLMSASCL